MQDYELWTGYAPMVLRVDAPWSWLEGPIYRFLDRQNEQSVRQLSEWLTAHREHRSDLASPG